MSTPDAIGGMDLASKPRVRGSRMPARVSSRVCVALGMIMMSGAAAGCAEDHSPAGDDAAVAPDASADAEDAGRADSTDPTCGVDTAPRWDVQLYEGTSPVATPERSVSSGVENTPVHIDVKGEVTSAGDGVPSDLEARELPGLATNIRYLRVKTADQTFTIVTHGIANFGAGLAAGAEVELSHHDDTLAYFAAPRGPLTTSLRAQDTTLFLYAFSARELSPPPGFEVKPGAAYCSAHDLCRTWTGHALAITDTSSEPLSLRPGQSGALAGYTWFAGSVVDEGPRHTPTEADRGFPCWENTPSATELLMIRH